MVKPGIVSVNIGKNGLTDSSINEIKTLLTKYKSIKIKFLQSASERTEFNKNVEKILNDCKSKLIKKSGFTIIISKN
jgi:RNA-binding protein